MTAIVPYVVLRDGVYQYHRRVPKSVLDRPVQFEALFGSRRLFRKSLGTKNAAEMWAVAAAVEVEFQTLVARAIGKDLPKSGPALLARKVTASDLAAIKERYRVSVSRPFARAHLMVGADPVQATELDRMTAELEMYADELSDAIASNKPSASSSQFETPVDIAKVIVKLQGFDAPAGSEAFGAIVNSVRAGLLQGYKHVDELADGTTLALSSEKGIAPAEPTLTIRRAVENKLDFMKAPPKFRSEAQLTLRTFEAVIGNKTLDKLTRADMKTFIKELSGFEVSAGSSRTSKALSLSTIKKRLGIIGSAINHAIDTDQFFGSNPASGIRLAALVPKPDKALMPNKRPFKVGELNQLFKHPWFTGCLSSTQTHEPGTVRLTGSEYWAPVVALYSGCRASELGGLKISEVLINDPFPHFIIRANEYRRIKGAHMRYVPILDGLSQLGFSEYVRRIAASGSDRLFPDWLPKSGVDFGPRFDKDDAAWSNARLLRSFNRTVVRKMLGHHFIDGARQELTFHNFRGSFKTMLSSSRFGLNSSVINDICGHAKEGMDARYIGPMQIEETYSAAHRCDYLGLELPRLP